MIPSNNYLFVESLHKQGKTKMNTQRKLFIIKLTHTAIWVFFNVVIFYALYAALENKIDKWFWLSLSLIGVEALVLILFKRTCPVTIIARRFSDSEQPNFDIFLPNWLARYNKLIYSVIVGFILLVLIYRLI